MRRRPLNVLTVASLLASVATGLLWAASYRSVLQVKHVLAEGRDPTEDVQEFYVYRRVWAGAALGRLYYGWVGTSGDPLDESELGWAFEAKPPEPWAPGDGLLGRLGFEFFWEPPMRHVTVPAWAVAVPTAVPPVLALRRLLRRRRAARRGLCRRCGYDLRATPGRCPECGAAARGRAVG